MAHSGTTRGPHVFGAAPPARVSAAAARRVAEANREAAAMSLEDARRIFAVRTHEALEGGRAAILTPTRRRGLMRLGRLLGLKPFDATLVIAIVQDGARRGERPDSDARRSSLDALRAQRAPSSDAGHGASLALSVLLAAVMLALLIVWVIG